MQPCAISSRNLCQSKNSGGHLGSILSVGTQYCAKRLSSGGRGNAKDKERMFYEQVWAVNSTYRWLRPFIPRYKGLCTHQDARYSVMQNLKAGMVQPRELDIKLGKATAARAEIKEASSRLGALWKKFRHSVLDRSTGSSSKGFRAEGVSDWKGSKFSLMRAVPEEVWALYFQGHLGVVKQVLKALERLIRVIAEHGHQLYLMGSSILILYDAEQGERARPLVKLIDFAHSEIGDIHKNHSHHQKVQQRYLEGLVRLFNSLRTYHDLVRTRLR